MNDRLQEHGTDASRWVASDDGSRTTVVIELDHWLLLWGRLLMHRVVDHYQRCAREAILRRACVELRVSGGHFVVMSPSAISGVLLVGDIHKGLNCMRYELRTALLSAYRSFGALFDDDETQLLCVRMGIDTGRVRTGPAMYSEGSVEVATRAAYRSGTCQSGLCVVTERTRSALSEEQLGVNTSASGFSWIARIALWHQR